MYFVPGHIKPHVVGRPQGSAQDQGRGYGRGQRGAAARQRHCVEGGVKRRYTAISPDATPRAAATNVSEQKSSALAAGRAAARRRGAVRRRAHAAGAADGGSRDRRAGGCRRRASLIDSSWATRRRGIAPKFVGQRSIARALRGGARDQPRTDADRRAGHRQELLSRAARRGDQRRLDAHHPGQRRHDRGPRSSTPGTTRCSSPRGRRERSLVPAPLYSGMQDGKIVRFEEITRCPLEIQDTLLSILCDRVMLVPELDGAGRHAASPPRASTSSPRPTRATAA